MAILRFYSTNYNIISFLMALASQISREGEALYQNAPSTQVGSRYHDLFLLLAYYHRFRVI